MKTVKLLLGALLLTTSVVARDYDQKLKESAKVIYIGNSQADVICEFDNTEDAKCFISERNAQREEVIEQVALDYLETSEGTSQSSVQPLYVFARPDNKFSFAVGGFLNLRASYDLKGIVDNIDFVTAAIPVPGSTSQKQQLIMDASTSRIYFKGIANTRALGRVMIYADFDMRGGEAGTYKPRLRTGYASFMGFTIGRDITTFCDLSAVPLTIDFQGPNALGFNYATVLRYERELIHERLKFGIAAEQPVISGTYNENFEPEAQRVPDVPMYLQVMWGESRQHHFRATAVLRNPYIYDLNQDKNISLLGWGVQGSGNIGITRWANILFNGTYGEGITGYISDLVGSGLDFTPKPGVPTTMQSTPMYGWQVSANIRPLERLQFNGGYSTVRIDGKDGYYYEEQYFRGDYIFGNIFYNITPRLQVACEYNHGYLEQVSGESGMANRLSLMAQYNF